MAFVVLSEMKRVEEPIVLVSEVLEHYSLLYKSSDCSYWKFSLILEIDESYVLYNCQVQGTMIFNGEIN